MSKSNFVRFHAPSLPPWPPLMIDWKKRHAVVSARLATWRSVENADMACWILTGIATVLISRAFWQYSSARTQPLEAVVFTFMATLVVAGVLHPLVPAAFRDFLARQVFCTKVKVWFRPEAIAFHSSLYSRPVVVRRSWKGVPVQCSFQVTKDLEAEARQDPSKAAYLTRHFKTASILRMVVETTNPYQAVQNVQPSVAVRDLPLTEIDESDASRVPIVLLLAASLTSNKAVEHNTSIQPKAGVDIDMA